MRTHTHTRSERNQTIPIQTFLAHVCMCVCLQKTKKQLSLRQVNAAGTVEPQRLVITRRKENAAMCQVIRICAIALECVCVC